jgi:hypothetical protein
MLWMIVTIVVIALVANAVVVGRRAEALGLNPIRWGLNALVAPLVGDLWMRAHAKRLRRLGRLPEE